MQMLTIISRCLHCSIYFLDRVACFSAGEKEYHCCWPHLSNVCLNFSRYLTQEILAYIKLQVCAGDSSYRLHPGKVDTSIYLPRQ